MNPRGILALRKGTPQVAQGAVEKRFNGPFTFIQGKGDFLQRQVATEAEKDRVALVGGKHSDRGAYPGPDLAPQDQLLRVRSGGRYALDQRPQGIVRARAVERDKGHPAIPPSLIDYQVAGNTRQIREKGFALEFVAAQMADKADKSFGGDVFRILGVAAAHQGKAEKATVIPTVKEA